MSTSLTTFDGYPRADIDVAQIRTTRARIIRLKNDHKEVMRKLEAAVHERFAAGNKSAEAESEPLAAGPLSASSGGQQQHPSMQSPAAIEPPFAKVNSVAPNSPAAQAGLQPGDQVSRFGDATFTNHERLGRVSRVVAANENVSLWSPLRTTFSRACPLVLVELRG